MKYVMLSFEKMNCFVDHFNKMGFFHRITIQHVSSYMSQTYIYIEEMHTYCCVLVFRCCTFVVSACVSVGVQHTSNRNILLLMFVTTYLESFDAPLLQLECGLTYM